MSNSNGVPIGDGIKPIHNLEQKFAEQLPQAPDDKRWICPTCGVMEPKLLTFGKVSRWIRTQCACEIRAKEKAKREEEHDAWLKLAFSGCYAWLGTARGNDMALKGKTFHNFEEEQQPDAFRAARGFVAHPSGALVLHGSFGTGKTHLLAAICNASIREKGVKARFTTSPKLFAAIQACIEADESWTSIITKAIQTPLLVLDDIDKAKYSEFREDVYFQIVDERVKNGLPIAISTNRLKSLADYVGGAVCSRLKVGQIDVEMIGEDYREEQS